MSPFEEWVVPMEDVGDQEQKSMVDFIEGKDWSPSYLNLECLSSFMNFETNIVRPVLVVKPRV